MFAIKKGSSYLYKEENSKIYVGSLENLGDGGYFFNTREEADSKIEELKGKGIKLKGWKTVEISDITDVNIVNNVNFEGIPEGYICYKGDHVVQKKGKDYEAVYYKKFSGSTCSTSALAAAIIAEIKSKKGKRFKGWAVGYNKGTAKKEDNIADKKIFVTNNHNISTEVDGELSRIEDVLKDIEQKYELYKKELSAIEKYLIDYYHYIEFSELDGTRGYKAYYIQRCLLRRRRDLKDNINKIEEMQGIYHSVCTVKAKFLQMKERNYVPRISNELFINNDKGMSAERNKAVREGNSHMLEKLYQYFKENNLSDISMEIMKGVEKYEAEISGDC